MRLVYLNIAFFLVLPSVLFAQAPGSKDDIFERTEETQKAVVDSLRQLSSKLESGQAKVSRSIDSAGKSNVLLIREKLRSRVDSSSVRPFEMKANKALMLQTKIRDPITSARLKLDGAAGNLTSSIPLLNTNPIMERLAADVDLPQIPSDARELVSDHHPGIPAIGKEDLPKIEFPEAFSDVEFNNVDLPQIDLSDIQDTGIGTLDLERFDENGVYLETAGQLANEEMPQLDKVGEMLEDKIVTSDHVAGLSNQFNVLTAQQAEYEALIQKYKDSKALEKELMSKAKNVVNDQINQHSLAVKKAQEKVGKAKRLVPSVQSFTKLKKPRFNTLKEIPFRDRLMPGLALSTRNSDVFLGSIGIQASYEWTEKIVLGAGGFSDFAFSEKYDSWVRTEKVFGVRGFTNLDIARSLFVHLEVTRSFGRIRISDLYQSPLTNYVFGNFGIGHRYRFTSKISGAGLVLYQCTIGDENPGLSKITTRLIINLNLSKKQKLLPPPQSEAN